MATFTFLIISLTFLHLVNGGLLEAALASGLHVLDLAVRSPVEDLVEISLFEIATSLSDLLLKSVDLLNVLSLLLVLLGLLVCLDGLVELLVLHS